MRTRFEFHDHCLSERTDWIMRNWYIRYRGTLTDFFRILDKVLAQNYVFHFNLISLTFLQNPYYYYSKQLAIPHKTSQALLPNGTQPSVVLRLVPLKPYHQRTSSPTKHHLGIFFTISWERNDKLSRESLLIWEESRDIEPVEILDFLKFEQNCGCQTKKDMLH